MDNAYLGEVFLGLIVLLMGLVFGLTWLVIARREGRRGLAAGAVPGIAFGAATLALGATRMFVPPALSVIELVLLTVFGAVTVAFSRADPRATRSTNDATAPATAKREWPADWSERVRGKDCPMCTEERPEVAHGSSRIFEGRVSDAYLTRIDVGQPGYSVVIWRGRHVADPTELSKDEASAYFDEVLRVGGAVKQIFKPIKMNFEMLGNSLPHLHTHVVPRYLDDGEPGHPPHFMRADLDLKNAPTIPEQAYARDLTSLRELLRD